MSDLVDLSNYPDVCVGHSHSDEETPEPLSVATLARMVISF